MYENFERIVKQKNLTNYAVSKATGVGQDVLSRWKNGKSTPSLDTIQALAAYLGVAVDTLLYGEHPPHTPQGGLPAPTGANVPVNANAPANNGGPANTNAHNAHASASAPTTAPTPEASLSPAFWDLIHAIQERDLDPKLIEGLLGSVDALLRARGLDAAPPSPTSKLTQDVTHQDASKGPALKASPDTSAKGPHQKNAQHPPRKTGT